MAYKHTQKKQVVDGKSEVSFKRPVGGSQPVHSRASYLPMFYFIAKDLLKDFSSRKNFPDALAIAFAIISVAIAFPLFPPIVLIPLVIVTFVITLVLPLGGLMAMLFETLLMFIYQAPLFAWIFTLFISISLILGYRHYRTITFIYVMIMLPLSYLGSLLEIPVFIIGVLFIGYRRSIVSTAVILLMVPMLAGLTGISISAPIVYNATIAHSSFPSGLALQYLSPSMPAPTALQFPPGIGAAMGRMFSFNVADQIFAAFGMAIASVAYSLELTLIQLFVWLITVFAMVNYVIKSRSAFKGAEASLYGFVILAAYAGMALFSGYQPNLLSMISFPLATIVVFALESSNIEVARALDVMKRDFLGKFGEAFEDITSGSRETLDDVANYDQTKKELREAILAPIEHREIAGAYNVKPAKGILMFGPPGTGKTLMMRAIANEIRARFFYVKTSSLISPFQGESAQALSKVFETARKHTPAVLFFDEIDGIASKREAQESDISRQVLTTLLSEMDGFQRVDGVVIVGSTNSPQLLDESIMRPGRFDKIMYMQLPDRSGRAKIFEHHMGRFPADDSLDYQKLAGVTSRYSGADIKNVCDEAARQVAEEAIRQHKVLKITLQDMLDVINVTKPSTSLASIDKYNQFKTDYERRAHPERFAENEDTVRVSDVVGLEKAKKALYEAIEIPILHPNLMKKYDVKDIRGILLFGPPGTGKTMLIRAVANELDGVKLITLSGAEISKNGFENALATIREAFNRARENAPCIIFIDEIDALLPSRSDSGQLYIQITSEFLQELDGMKDASGIVMVGATNRPDMLDTAIIRPGRVDKFIFVPPPGSQDRASIFRENLKKVPLDGDMDFERLASQTEGYTGADIANICREAKMGALEADLSSLKEKRITTDDMLEIIHAIKPSAPSNTMGSYMSFISLYGGR